MVMRMNQDEDEDDGRATGDTVMVGMSGVTFQRDLKQPKNTLSSQVHLPSCPAPLLHTYPVACHIKRKSWMLGVSAKIWTRIMRQTEIRSVLNNRIPDLRQRCQSL